MNQAGGVVPILGTQHAVQDGKGKRPLEQKLNQYQTNKEIRLLDIEIVIELAHIPLLLLHHPLREEAQRQNKLRVHHRRHYHYDEEQTQYSID